MSEPASPSASPAPASLEEVAAAAVSRAYLGAGPPAGADARPGAAGLPSLGEARAYAPGPKWFRFPAETWTMIRGEYLAGATARQIALKWGVSPTSVYRHACQDGFTKARRGEAINLEAVARFAAEAAAVEARAKLAAQALVAERAAVEDEAEPVEAARVLVRRAAARALKGKAEEALALVKLAEGLARAAAALPPVPEEPWADDGEDDDSPEEVEALRERLVAVLVDRVRQPPAAAGDAFAPA